MLNFVNPLGDKHSFVKLVKWVGTETDIVNSARISVGSESQELNDKDIGLINFLMREHHGTPFEQGFMSIWHIKLPIFVMREWARHRIGVSINELSGRYSKYRCEYYVPTYIRSQIGKPGAYKFAAVDHKTAKVAQEMIMCNSEATWMDYEVLLQLGIAKEQARLVLPQNFYTEIRWTCNARSLMHFLALRNSEQAMWEIQSYARSMEWIFGQHMPNVHGAFVEHGRVCP